jgi:hypothetical protein
MPVRHSTKFELMITPKAAVDLAHRLHRALAIRPFLRRGSGGASYFSSMISEHHEQ